MAALQSNGYFRDNTIIWELEGNEFDFTLDEFVTLMSGLTDKGLFHYLRAERPALLDQLTSLLATVQGSFSEEKEVEYLLEQCLFGLEQKLVLH